MSFLRDFTAQLPFIKKAAEPEYFFALNIGLEKIKACIWKVEKGSLSVLNPLSEDYSSTDEILDIADKLLDRCLGDLPYEPDKILFGVPDSFLMDEELKEPYLKLIRDLVKSLDISPMAYVATSHAVSHFLDKKEGGPTTAILVDIEREKLSVAVSRAGKIDGTKVLVRGDSIAGDVEKGLLSFTDIEVLPSRILIYGYSTEGLEKQKDDLLSFAWMSKLPFLHFPKIEILDTDTDIRSVALAGAVEIDPDVKFSEEAQTSKRLVGKAMPLMEEPQIPKPPLATGFITGDITEKSKELRVKSDESEKEEEGLVGAADDILDSEEEVAGEDEVPEDDFDEEPPRRQVQKPAMEVAEMEDEEAYPVRKESALVGILPTWLKIPSFGGGKTKFAVPILILVLLILSYLFLPKAEVVIFVEPKILEKDTQVIADPTVKVVDEEAKKIPGQIVETSVSGTDKIAATGKKQVGDPAKGTVKIINNSLQAQTISQGTALTASGMKFTLDKAVNIASTSATSDSKSTATASVTAVSVGADGNLPSGTQLSSSNSQIAIVAEGNFSGGTSKEVTVVTDADQKKLLAQLASSLRKQAQGDIQNKLVDKKILEEALTEEITKKTYNKSVNDQASEFSLNLTIKYTGIAYADSDLKMIVAKLVDTNIPEGYQLDLSETESQVDVSKMEKNQLVFLARFKAKLAPKLDLEKIKSQLRGQTPEKAAEILRGYENVLESEVKITPSFPGPLSRLPLMSQRIEVEVKLK